VSSSYVAFPGDTDDATYQLPTIGGDDTQELGQQVAEFFADETSTTVMSVAPSTGDLHEVTFDVVGLADDSVRGFRLRVFVSPEFNEVTSVERTTFCGRGVSGGLCV